MSRAADALSMTYAEYVAAESTSECKHEWLAGEVFAMAGGTPEHAALEERWRSCSTACAAPRFATH